MLNRPKGSGTKNSMLPLLICFDLFLTFKTTLHYVKQIQIQIPDWFRPFRTIWDHSGLFETIWYHLIPFETFGTFGTFETIFNSIFQGANFVFPPSLKCTASWARSFITWLAQSLCIKYFVETQKNYKQTK